MPATAGRVRMPANNRVHSSAALQTHGIWQSAIGYDPYAPVSNKKESKPDNDPENAYASFKGLLALARITSGGTNSDEARGACRKCGRIGHLTYQCRNFLSLKEDEKEGDDSALRAANAVFEKIKKAKEETEIEGDGDESESSDSSVDPEIERIIAERFGKPMSKKVGSLKKRSNSSGDDGDGDDEERKHKRKRGRHRDSDGDESDSDRNRKRRRRGKRRMSDSESSSDESDGHRRRRRSRRRKERRSVLSSESESTASSSDEDERGKRREKRRRRRRGHKREQRY